MVQAVENKTVVVVYDGKLENGEVFESSAETGPLEFQLGSNSVFPGFEKGIVGMKVGETRSFEVEPAEAYGLHREELLQTLERQVVCAGMEPHVGMVLGLSIEKDGERHQVPAMIVKVSDDEVIVDFNHPLAGRKVTYTVTVTEIR